MKYFVSFVEENIFNEKYKDYKGGRIEIYVDNEQYAIEEIRFLTDDIYFYKFREKWDIKEINEKQLLNLKKIIKNKYYEI